VQTAADEQSLQGASHGYSHAIIVVAADRDTTISAGIENPEVKTAAACGAYSTGGAFVAVIEAALCTHPRSIEQERRHSKWRWRPSGRERLRSMR
jgi:hypothetical protein